LHCKYNLDQISKRSKMDFKLILKILKKIKSEQIQNKIKF